MHVELSRPEKMNSLDLPMFKAIAETAVSLRDDQSVRAVILSGRGKAFCSGLDMKSVGTKGNPFKTMERLLEKPSGYHEDDSSSISQRTNLAQDVSYLWRTLPVPVIAVLHGSVFGGGLQIALGADLRFCTPDCRFSVMEAKWGIIPDMSISLTLRELVRIDVAKELTMTGRIVDGVEAARLGLVTRCCGDDDDAPLKEAMRVAREIVTRNPDAVSATKRLFQETWVEGDGGKCLDLETELQRDLLGSYNVLAATGRNFNMELPYWQRKK